MPAIAPAVVQRCANGHTAKQCAVLVAELFDKGKQGDRNNRLCPLHDDRKASLSINAGRQGMWLVWYCGAGCDPHGDRIRGEALDRGADPACLGGYGKPQRPLVPGLRVATIDPVLAASAKRWFAVEKLPRDLSGPVLKMCIQAIGEGDGDLVGDPIRLLPWTKKEFIALAARAGIERTYRYKLWDQWSVQLARSLAA